MMVCSSKPGQIDPYDSMNRQCSAQEDRYQSSPANPAAQRGDGFGRGPSPSLDSHLAVGNLGAALIHSQRFNRFAVASLTV